MTATTTLTSSGDFVGAPYSATRKGIWWGADGVPGNGDDVVRVSGDGSEPVNELLYVGVGDGFLADEPTSLSDQGRIDSTIADILAGCSDPSGCLIDVIGRYSLPDGSGGNGLGPEQFHAGKRLNPRLGLLTLIGMSALILLGDVANRISWKIWQILEMLVVPD